MNQDFYNSNSSGFDQFQPPQYPVSFQPPDEISIKELKTMMQSCYEIMSQRREREAIPLQDQAVEEKQEFTSSTTYTIHLTKSATIITNPSEPTRRVYHNHDIFYDGDDNEELFPDEIERIQKILERTSFDAITPDFSITNSLSMGDEHLSTILETESDELIKSSVENLVPNLKLQETIDTIVYTITEASISDKLNLADASGITMLPNNEIFEGMGHMGYPIDGSFTFWKSFFTPQWRFLVHHLLHCISSKSGRWDQFDSNIATALICLSIGRVYNFSKLIFDGMVANLKSKTKFLMYPRFLQLILDIQTENKVLDI
ncbi:hypothetical protein Tco_1009537 [Tanacetum coccineum]